MSVSVNRLVSVTCDAKDCFDGLDDYETAHVLRRRLRLVGWRCDRRTGDHCPLHRGPIDRVEMAP